VSYLHPGRRKKKLSIALLKGGQKKKISSVRLHRRCLASAATEGAMAQAVFPTRKDPAALWKE